MSTESTSPWRPLLLTVSSFVAICWPAWVIRGSVLPATHPTVTRDAIQFATAAAIGWMAIGVVLSYRWHTRYQSLRTWQGQLAALLMWVLYLYVALYAAFLGLMIPAEPDPNKGNEPFFGVRQDQLRAVSHSANRRSLTRLLSTANASVGLLPARCQLILPR